MPGSALLQASETGYAVSVHHYTTHLFRLSLRRFQSSTELSFTITEACHYIRLETVITGELTIKNPDGTATTLLAGEYRISDTRTYELLVNPSAGCLYFVVFISPALIEQTPMGELIKPCGQRMMAVSTRAIITRLLDNPFEEKSRDAFYDCSIRELLFYHLSAPPFTPPGELTPPEIAAVYAADAIIAANPTIHYTIPELAKMVHTNEYVLKTGFPRIFSVSVFDRHMQRKMDRAKYLLETTDKQIQEIGELTGYETPTGFINAFKRLFKMSPKDWRKKSRGLM